MNALPAEVRAAPALAMREEELCSVLQNSLYPGAKMESIKLVISYCKASGLDPMQKPVHIVPMNVKKVGTRDEYEWRDVVMPGVGLYRTQAARTGALAGISEPEFGPTKTLKINDFECEYPEWARVTVRRILGNGHIAEFTATERWLENYATRGKDSKVPNAMWAKRPFGQLGKCAQAQALRMAFPEMTGAAPTADELEGKTLDEGLVIDGATGEVHKIGEPQRKQPRAVEPERGTVAEAGGPENRPPPPANPDPAGAPAGDPEPMKPSQVAILKKKMANAGLTDVDLSAKFGKPLCDGELPNYTFADFNAIAAWINERAAG